MLPWLPAKHKSNPLSETDQSLPIFFRSGFTNTHYSHQAYSDITIITKGRLTSNLLLLWHMPNDLSACPYISSVCNYCPDATISIHEHYLIQVNILAELGSYQHSLTCVLQTPWPAIIF